MAEGQGNIIYGPRGGAGGGGIVVAGARDGLSVDTAGYIVLGQTIDQAGNPAQLLEAKEVPLNSNSLNWFGGGTILSDERSGGTSAILDVVLSAFSPDIPPVVRITVGDITTSSGGNAAVTISAFDSALQPTPGANCVLFQIEVNDSNVFDIAENGSSSWQDPNSGEGFFEVNNSIYIAGEVSGSGLATVGISSDIEQAAFTGAGYFSDLTITSFIADTGGAMEYRGFSFLPEINRSSTGITRGIYLAPDPIIVGGKYIAFENNAGDVYLNSTGGPQVGRTGIHEVTAPTAWLHLGAGAAAASSAPLKFTSGINQLTAEAGAMEYNGTNLFFSPAASTRLSVLMATDEGSAPATTTPALPTAVYGTATALLATPGHWAAVVVGGVLYKIPLYS
jgi:hypothetical protein